MRKFLIYFVTLLLVIILVSIVSFRFFPKLYVSAFNHFSTEQVSVEQLSINFVPLEISVENLGVTNSQQATIATVEKVKLSAQLIAWFRDKQNFWKANVSNANIKLINLPQRTSNSSSSNSLMNKVNVHKILSSFDLRIDKVQVYIDDRQSIHVEKLHTNLNDNDLSDYKLIEQDVDFVVSYFGTANANELPLKLSGFIQSRYVQGVSILKLSISEIDLSSFVASNDVYTEMSSSDNDVKIEKNIQEAELNWQWLSSVDPLQVDVKVDKILWSKSSIKNVDLTFKLDESMAFSFQSDVTWKDSSEFSFEDTIQLAGQWQSISSTSVGADLRGESTLTTSTLNLKFNGDLNVNGTNGNKLSIELDSTKLPIQGLLDKKMQTLVDQYFPVKALFEVQQTAQTTELKFEEVVFGDSDLKGQVSLNATSPGPLGINARLESMLFSYKGVDNETMPNKKIKLKKENIFDDKAIDWSWLDTLLVDIDWKAKRVLVDNIEINELHLPVTVSLGKLDILGLEAVLGGGQITSKSSLEKKGESVDVDVDLTASGVVLEQLNLLPSEELKKAVTDLSVALKTSGRSSRELAQSMDGQVKINVGDGVIGNDSFELIGSDLVLSLLNKLNPFAKKDKTTQLECAVVNLDIEKGRINIDKSLALRTSKLTMVADGYVDLSSEKVKLNITPKAKQGIGIDVSSLVKFVALGGTLTTPKPVVTASGVVKSAIVIGAAVSTGGVSLLASNVAEKTVTKIDVCKRADKAFK